MTYGERKNRDGTVTRFVIAAIDLYQASPSDPTHVNADGFEIAVVDVTDPDRPYLRGRTPATTSTHTVQCLSKNRLPLRLHRRQRRFVLRPRPRRPRPAERGGRPRALAGRRAGWRLPARRGSLLGLRRPDRLAHRLGRRRGVRCEQPAEPGAARHDRRGGPDSTAQRLHPPQRHAAERLEIRRRPRRSRTATSCWSPRRTTPTTATS